MLLRAVVAFEGVLPTPQEVDEQRNTNDQYNQATYATPYCSTGTGLLLVIVIAVFRDMFGEFWVGKKTDGRECVSAQVGMSAYALS